ncbi:hypothetical protein OAB15_05160 [Porticoccaceae bacterium]|nr:hypothetical protein [Porticoccaceae bacterium]
MRTHQKDKQSSGEHDKHPIQETSPRCTCLADSNRCCLPLLFWAGTSGALGFISKLQEPILPNHEVRWQTSPPECETTKQRPPNMNQNSGEV